MKRKSSTIINKHEIEIEGNEVVEILGDILQLKDNIGTEETVDKYPALWDFHLFLTEIITGEKQ